MRPSAPYRTAYPARRAGHASKARLLWAHVWRGLALRLLRRKRRLDARHAPPPPRPTIVYPRSHASSSGLWVIGIVVAGALHALRLEARDPRPPPPPRSPFPMLSVPSVLPTSPSVDLERIRSELRAMPSNEHGWTMMPPASAQPEPVRPARKAAKPTASPPADGPPAAQR